MTPYLIAPEAQRDIDAIFVWTTQTFGVRPAYRYETLILRAMSDVANDPERPGSIPIVEVAPDMRIYHLRHSRNRAAAAGDRVKNPRHFLMYRFVGGAPIEVIRMLHDRMDADQQNADPSR